MLQKFNLCIAFMLCAGLVLSQDLEKLSKKTDKLFTKYITPGKPGGAVVVIKDGKVVHKNAYGLGDYENKVPLTTNSVFDIASVSKQFAGYAVALLEKEGKLSLEDDVRKYIPEFPDFGHTVTVGHLLFHQSGLRDWPATMKLAGVGYEDVLTFEQILSMAYQQEALNFTPGSRHLYSNTGYNVLVEVIQRITGQPFREWTTEKIFQPLGMQNTFFRDQHDEAIANSVKSYFKKSDKMYRDEANLSFSTNGLTAMGSSSLQTTIDDFALWLQYLDSEEARELVELMQVPGELTTGEPASYAYGLEIDRYQGMKRVSHDGGWASFNTYMAYFPEQHFSVAVFLNHRNWVYGFGQEVVKIYLEDEFKEVEDEPSFYNENEPKLAQDLSLDLSRYTGIFYLEKYLSYLHIFEEEGQLYVQATDEDKQPMQPVTATRFWVEAYESSIYYNEGADGNMESVTYHKSLCPKREAMQAKDLRNLSIYKGHFYSSELNTTYQVLLEEGELKLSNLRNGQISLEQVWKDGFMSDTGYAPRVDFQRNEDGEVISFAVSQYRSRNQVFRKLDIGD